MREIKFKTLRWHQYYEKVCSPKGYLSLVAIVVIIYFIINKCTLWANLIKNIIIIDYTTLVLRQINALFYIPTVANSMSRQQLLESLKLSHLTPPAGKFAPYNLSCNLGSYKEHDDYHLAILDVLKKHKISVSKFLINYCEDFYIVRLTFIFFY